MKEDKEQDTLIMPRSFAGVKAVLTEVHKVQQWALFAASLKLTEPEKHYHHSFDSIHVDEMWFFISEKATAGLLSCSSSPLFRRHRFPSF